MVLRHPWGPPPPARPRAAGSLRRLGEQVDDLWPDRSRATDGWIGDAAHVMRDSDHNPDPKGIVHAIDITAEGIQPWVVVVAACRHPATHYVIFHGLIWSRTYGFQPRGYTGKDPHVSHVHVSILRTRQAEHSHRRWLPETFLW